MGLPKVSHVETGFAGLKESGATVLDYDVWKAAKS